MDSDYGIAIMPGSKVMNTQSTAQENLKNGANTGLSRWPEVATEFVGTFILVMVITSALTATLLAGQSSTPWIILLNALLVAVPLGWLTFSLSEGRGGRGVGRLGQFNPATTVLLFLGGRITIVQAVVNILSQTLAAFVAGIGVGLLYGNPGVEVGLGSVQPVGPVGMWPALVAELVGSAVILVTIALHLRKGSSLSTLAVNVGLATMVAALLATGLSGASFNPVRAVAPLLLAAGDTSSLWLYLISPVLAAVGAHLVVGKGSEAEVVSEGVNAEGREFDESLMYDQSEEAGEDGGEIESDVFEEIEFANPEVEPEPVDLGRDIQPVMPVEAVADGSERYDGGAEEVVDNGDEEALEKSTESATETLPQSGKRISFNALISGMRPDREEVVSEQSAENVFEVEGEATESSTESSTEPVAEPTVQAAEDEVSERKVKNSVAANGTPAKVTFVDYDKMALEEEG